MQTFFVDVALEFPYLLHAILGVAALHLTRTGAPRHADHLRLAESHHKAALARFRSDVRDLDSSNFEAVYLFAYLLLPLASGLNFGRLQTAEEMLSGMVQNMTLTRMIGPMVKGHYKELLASRLSCLIPSEYINLDWSEPSDPENNGPASLKRFAQVAQTLYPPDISEAYSDAIVSMLALFEFSRKSLNPPLPVLSRMWSHQISSRFLELLADMQPGALIIFAHYAVLLFKVDHIWYIKGAAAQTLDVANKLVPAEWKAWLDWPKEQIFGGGSSAQDG